MGDAFAILKMGLPLWESAIAIVIAIEGEIVGLMGWSDWEVQVRTNAKMLGWREEGWELVEAVIEIEIEIVARRKTAYVLV